MMKPHKPPTHMSSLREQRIGRELMQMLYQALPYNSLFHISAGFVLCAVLWTVGERQHLLLWWLAVALLSLLRLASYAYYRRGDKARHSSRFWNLTYGVGALAMGLLWGLAGVLLAPHEIISYELFVGFLVAGMAMGAVPILSSVKEVYWSFALAAELPYIIHLLGHEGDLYAAVAIIHGLFLLLMLIVSIRMHKLIRESLALKFHNIDLVEELKASNALMTGEVSSHRETDKRLHENQQRLSALADATFEGIILHQNSVILEANRGMADMTGYTTHELVGRSVESLFMPGCRLAVMDYIQSSLGGQLDAEALRRDGSSFPIEIRIGFVPYAGEHVAFVVIRDITNYKELVKAQALGRKKAEEADRAKTEFLAAVSHELRTPLNAIMGFTQLLQDTPLTAEQKEYLSITYHSGGQLLKLIDDLLDLSRIESGRFDLLVQSFNLREELNSMLGLLSIKLAESGNILRVNFAEDLPEAIEADPMRLRQVLINLLSNAIKFTEHGSIEFNVSCTAKWLRLVIKDTGKGIPEDKLEFVFGKFNQVDSSASRAHGGAGLGLAISRRLVESMGGKISVQSKLHEGATFVVELPLHRAVITEKDNEAVIQENDDTDATQSQAMNILLVEDDETNQMIAVALLQQQGHQITIAEHGREAIELCQQGHAFDVILMDIQMPVMDGITATRLLREQGITLPIIAMTANAMAGDREEYLKAGMDEYISKPIFKATLLQVLHKFALAG